jgi:hypothetical protein
MADAVNNRPSQQRAVAGGTIAQSLSLGDLLALGFDIIDIPSYVHQHQIWLPFPIKVSIYS